MISTKKQLLEPDNQNGFEFEENFNKRSIYSKKNIDIGFFNIIQKMDIRQPSVGEIINAAYVGETSSHLLFDAYFKDYIRINNRVYESKFLKNTKIGDKIDVLIINVDEKNFMIEGSISTIYENKVHDNLKALPYESCIMGIIREMAPAGYWVDIVYQGVTINGFMPNTLAGINRLHDPESIVGMEMNLMIESYSKDEGTYIVSRKRYLQSLIPEAIKELEYKKKYTGHITGTTEFGAFVEFNECLTGMIHKSNINPIYIDKLSEIQPGTEVDFYIKEIIKDKIILTQTQKKSLWDTIEIGQVLSGIVKENKQFGTLVTLDDETIGLIHISELEKFEELPKNGQTIKVKIIAIDRQNRKIFLTTNQRKK